MGAYIIRRLLLVIPTLLGIMIINFALTQFVPGGPIEQILAELEGQGDVFEGISGGSSEIADTGDGDYIGGRGLPADFIAELEREHAWLTELRADLAETERNCARLMAALTPVLELLPGDERRRCKRTSVQKEFLF